jgi:hypothetical protein
MEHGTERPTAGSGVGAWRVTFAYDGERVRVVGKQRVATRPPPDDTEAISDDASGYWIEVRDRSGRSLHRQVIANPLSDQLEVFSADPNQPLHHVVAPEPSGVFQVLVPDDPAGHEIVFHGRAATPEVHARSSRQLVRAVLREQEPEGLA